MTTPVQQCQPCPPRARARTDEDIAVINAVALAVPLDTVTYDRGDMHNPANPSRLTVPAGWAGSYSAGANVRFLAGTDDAGLGYRTLQVRLNGTIIIASQQIPDVKLGTEPTDLNVHTDYELLAGDYIELVVRQGMTTPESIAVDMVAEFSAALWLTGLHR